MTCGTAGRLRCSAVRIGLELQPRIDGQPHVGVSGVGGIVGQEIDDAERAETLTFLWSIGGTHRHPERFSRRFVGQVAQARKALGADLLPAIRLHDLRHTHATLLLADGVPVKVVSERLGHANATIMLTVYQHVHPGMGRQAADRFAALLGG
jgi:integrase